MDSSQTSPMRSFPKNCFPANILNLNYFLFRDLLTMIFTFLEDPHLAAHHIWHVLLMRRAASSAPPPPPPPPWTPWWPRTNLSMVQTRVTWCGKLRKGMTDNRKCSDFNMLLQFVNLESIKELIDAIESYGMSTRGSRSNFEERIPVVTLTS